MRRVLVTERLPSVPSFSMPPPVPGSDPPTKKKDFASFSVRRLSSRRLDAGPWVKMPPPCLAELASNKVRVIAKSPKLKMPPPPASIALLESKVVLSTTRCPPFQMPPPSQVAEFDARRSEERRVG